MIDLFEVIHRLQNNGHYLILTLSANELNVKNRIHHLVMLRWEGECNEMIVLLALVKMVQLANPASL
jgi:hypothetical protein